MVGDNQIGVVSIVKVEKSSMFIDHKRLKCFDFVPQKAFSIATFWCARDAEGLHKSMSTKNQPTPMGVDVKTGSSRLSGSRGRSKRPRLSGWSFAPYPPRHG